MDIERRCSWCGKTFIAHSYGNRYCCERCKSDAKKARKKRREAEPDSDKNTLPEVEMLGSKPFLSPKEVAILFAVSLPTVYRYMADGTIKSLKITNNRTVIRRSDLEKMFEEAPSYKKRKYGRKNDTEYYTMRDIVEKYNVSRKGAMNRIKKFRIPKIYDGRNTFFPKKAVEENFAELLSDVVVTDFYTIPQIMEKYDMTHNAVLSFVQRHNISRKTILRKVYYNREEIDKLKNPVEDVEYYTYPQLQQVYGLTKNQISYYTHAYHLTTTKRGSFTLIKRNEFDAIMRHRAKSSGIEPKESTKDATIESLLKRKDEDMLSKIPDGYMSIEEISEKYALTIKHVQKLTRDLDIKEKKKIGGRNYFPSEAIEKAFAKYEASPWVKLWISAKDMEEQYLMTPEARRSFAYRHKIPTKMVKGKVFYSKDAIDKVKSEDFDGKDKYYSMEEIMEKYGVTKWTVYNKVKYYKIRKVHKSQFSYFNKEDIERIFGEKGGETENKNR